MYVVGLEEMVDLTATTVVLEAQSQKRAGVWLEMVSNALNRGAKNDVDSLNGHQQESTYVLVEHQILVGVFLCVFIRKSLRPRLQNVMSNGLLLLLTSSHHSCYWLVGYDGKQGWCRDSLQADGQHSLLRLLSPCCTP